MKALLSQNYSVNSEISTREKKNIYISIPNLLFRVATHVIVNTKHFFFFLFPLRFSTVPRGIIYSFFKMCVDGHTCISNCLWVASWNARILKGDNCHLMDSLEQNLKCHLSNNDYPFPKGTKIGEGSPKCPSLKKG